MQKSTVVWGIPAAKRTRRENAGVSEAGIRCNVICHVAGIVIVDFFNLAHPVRRKMQKAKSQDSTQTR